MISSKRRNNRIPVWIVDDNKSFCIILAESLNESRSVVCTKYYHSSTAAINALARADSPPSVILLDIKMQKFTGLDAIDRLKQISPGTAIIMLTSYDVDENIQTALKRGASGFLLKSSTPEQIITAVSRTRAGVRALDQHILDRMIDSYLGQVDDNHYLLTEREKEIIKRISAGLNTREVAAELNLSYYTVDTHLKNIFQKLQVHTRHGMVAKASKEHLF
jgi:DNA-binding NarL/FixJ family response regulator